MFQRRSAHCGDGAAFLEKAVFLQFQSMILDDLRLKLEAAAHPGYYASIANQYPGVTDRLGVPMAAVRRAAADVVRAGEGLEFLEEALAPGAMAELLLPGEIVSMTARAANRLVAGGNGDAALLYLHLLHYERRGIYRECRERRETQSICFLPGSRL